MCCVVGQSPVSHGIRCLSTPSCSHFKPGPNKHGSVSHIAQWATPLLSMGHRTNVLLLKNICNLHSYRNEFCISSRIGCRLQLKNIKKNIQLKTPMIHLSPTVHCGVVYLKLKHCITLLEAPRVSACKHGAVARRPSANTSFTMNFSISQNFPQTNLLKMTLLQIISYTFRRNYLQENCFTSKRILPLNFLHHADMNINTLWLSPPPSIHGCLKSFGTGSISKCCV